MSDSTKPPTMIRVRHDLQAFPRTIGSDAQWVIKDPVSFSHFLFSQQELFLLELFNGERTLDQIRMLWQQHFQTRALTVQQLEMMTQRFVRDKLVIVEQFGNGVRFHQDEAQTKRSQWLMKFSSPLVIKLGGVDPRGVLYWLWLPGQILFNRIVMMINLLMAAIVFVYFLGHFEQIAARAVSMAEFFSVKNLLLMFAVILAVKIVHELGHALACQKFGGECFEIGVLLLAFFPTLYCDVTDSWTFAERWKRMVVSFAGIYIEILLATSGAVLWLVTDPGLANSVFFNVAVMGSVNTLFVNGNPLLKYDGYYLVSDYFEQPNLAENARQSFRRWMAGFFFDVSPTTASLISRSSAWLALFGCCSLLYRTFVIFSIAIGVSLMLKRFEFGILGDGIVGLLVFSVGFRMLKRRPGERTVAWRQINLVRSLSSLAAIGLLGIAWFGLPVPAHRYCNFVVEAQQSAMIYAPRDGRLRLTVDPYANVDKDGKVGQIIQPELAERQQQTERQLNNLADRAKRLVRRFDQSPTIASDLQILKNETQQVQAQAEMLEHERQSLILQAPLAGMIRPLPLDLPPADRELAAPVIRGTFFDRANTDCFVRRGQPLLVVEGKQRRLVSYLGEKDVEFLEVGQTAVLAFQQFPNQQFRGEIAEIIEIDAQLNESETQSAGLETFVDQTGKTQTIQTPYRVIIEIENLPVDVLVGASGRARVSVPMQTLAAKTWSLIERWWQTRNY